MTCRRNLVLCAIPFAALALAVIAFLLVRGARTEAERRLDFCLHVKSYTVLISQSSHRFHKPKG